MSTACLSLEAAEEAVRRELSGIQVKGLPSSSDGMKQAQTSQAKILTRYAQEVKKELARKPSPRYYVPDGSQDAFQVFSKLKREQARSLVATGNKDMLPLALDACMYLNSHDLDDLQLMAYCQAELQLDDDAHDTYRRMVLFGSETMYRLNGQPHPNVGTWELQASRHMARQQVRWHEATKGGGTIRNENVAPSMPEEWTNSNPLPCLYRPQGLPLTRTLVFDNTAGFSSAIPGVAITAAGTLVALRDFRAGETIGTEDATLWVPLGGAKAICICCGQYRPLTTSCSVCRAALYCSPGCERTVWKSWHASICTHSKTTHKASYGHMQETLRQDPSRSMLLLLVQSIGRSVQSDKWPCSPFRLAPFRVPNENDWLRMQQSKAARDLYRERLRHRTVLKVAGRNMDPLFDQEWFDAMSTLLQKTTFRLSDRGDGYFATLRFLTHSCTNANVEIARPVFGRQGRMPALRIRASRDIRAGDVLSFDAVSGLEFTNARQRYVALAARDICCNCSRCWPPEQRAAADSLLSLVFRQTPLSPPPGLDVSGWLGREWLDRVVQSS